MKHLSVVRVRSVVHDCLQKLRDLITSVIEPAPTIKAADQRQRMRIVNGMLLVFAVVNITVLCVRAILTPETLSTTVTNVSVTLLVLLGVYLVGKRGWNDIALKIILVLGTSLLLMNAYRSTPPHFEIAYLIFIPLFSTVLFAGRTTVALSVMVIVLVLGYIQITPTVEREVALDLMTFTSLTLIFILVINYQRSMLEKSRHKMAMDKERADLLNQILSYMSHDLKTPLTVINTSVYLMKHPRTPPERQPQLLKQIEDQSHRLQKSIQDVLTMARLDHVLELTQEKVDLNRLINQASEQFAATAQEKEVAMRVNVDGMIPPMLGNKDSLERLITNLIENALNYSKAGSMISITTQRQIKAVLIEVCDTGIGISEADLPHIFEHFYRADEARSTNTGGSGLGLSIVRRAVDFHHGEITVESKLGSGTTFRVTLPTLT